MEESLPSPKRPTTNMSSSGRSSTPFSSKIDPKLEIRQARETSTTRDRTRTHQASPCRCMGVTLGHLEKVQGHTKLNSLCSAERSLNSLKKSISQCHALLQCSSCRNPSRVMTFLILLIEKMIGMLEDIASVWETGFMSSSSDRDSSQLDLHGHAHRWLPIHIGQFQIDSVQERFEVFGFLILLQARHMNVFLEGLVSHAARENWESQQNALRPVGLRIRDLQETLGAMTSGSGR